MIKNLKIFCSISTLSLLLSTGVTLGNTNNVLASEIPKTVLENNHSENNSQEDTLEIFDIENLYFIDLNKYITNKNNEDTYLILNHQGVEYNPSCLDQEGKNHCIKILDSTTQDRICSSDIYLTIDTNEVIEENYHWSKDLKEESFLDFNYGENLSLSFTLSPGKINQNTEKHMKNLIISLFLFLK